MKVLEFGMRNAECGILNKEKFGIKIQRLQLIDDAIPLIRATSGGFQPETLKPEPLNLG